MAKSRLSKENKQVGIRLYYDERGLDRYYGLLELGDVLLSSLLALPFLSPKGVQD